MLITEPAYGLWFPRFKPFFRFPFSRRRRRGGIRKLMKTTPKPAERYVENVVIRGKEHKCKCVTYKSANKTVSSCLCKYVSTTT